MLNVFRHLQGDRIRKLFMARSDVEAFKNELKNLRYYHNKMDFLADEIAMLEYEMANVKGVDYSKQGGNNYNASAVEYKKLKMIDQYEELLKKKKKLNIRIADIYEVLDRMDVSDRALVMGVVAEKRKYRDMCRELGISNTSILYNRINEIIERAIQ